MAALKSQLDAAGIPAARKADFRAKVSQLQVGGTSLLDVSILVDLCTVFEPSNCL